MSASVEHGNSPKTPRTPAILKDTLDKIITNIEELQAEIETEQTTPILIEPASPTSQPDVDKVEEAIRKLQKIHRELKPPIADTDTDKSERKRLKEVSLCKLICLEG